MKLRNTPRQFMMIATALVTVMELAGCSNKYGTVAPPLPISLDQAQAQANIKQAGINVSRQFVSDWEAAKGTMKNDLEQCSLSASSGYGSHQACWQHLQEQSLNYANQFAGMTVSGLTPEQSSRFTLARDAAVNFFHFSARYATACAVSTQNCLRQSALRMKMDSERKSVDSYLMGTRIVPSSASGALGYENQAVNNNLEALRNPTMVPPADNQPAIQQGQ
ncbi:MAG: hypothetical protein K0041_08795 [Acidithiobacillus sp.]|nr:hypothetical protein [Acidithiobacillus sp.]